MVAHAWSLFQNAPCSIGQNVLGGDVHERIIILAGLKIGPGARLVGVGGVPQRATARTAAFAGLQGATRAQNNTEYYQPPAATGART